MPSHQINRPPAAQSPYETPEASNDNLKKMVGGLSVLSIGLLISTIVLAINQGGDAPAESTPAVAIEDVATVDAPAVQAEPVTEPSEPMNAEEEFMFLAKKWESSFYTKLDANICAGAKLWYPSITSFVLISKLPPRLELT